MVNMYQNEQTNKVAENPATDQNSEIAQIKDIKDIIKTLKTRVDYLTQELDKHDQATKRLNNKLNSLTNEVKRLSTRL